jgi:hypothetical protein
MLAIVEPEVSVSLVSTYHYYRIGRLVSLLSLYFVLIHVQLVFTNSGHVPGHFGVWFGKWDVDASRGNRARRENEAMTITSTPRLFISSHFSRNENGNAFIHS